MWLQGNKSCNLDLLILIVFSIVLYLSLLLLRLEISEGLMPCVCKNVLVVCD
jgi:hypothetical protein